MMDRTCAGRHAGLDLLRVLAAFAVVVFHVATPLLADCGPAFSTYWLKCSLMVAMSAWCVPVFVLISGSVNLSNPESSDARLFFRKRRSFFLRVVAWTVFFVSLRLCSERGYMPGDAMRDLWRGIPYYHLWFLYMIAGLYAVTPLLFRLICGCSSWWMDRIVVVLLILPSVITLERDLYMEPLQQTVLTIFIPFLGYYVAGSALSKVRGIDRGRWLWVLVAAVAMTGLSFQVKAWRESGMDRAAVEFFYGAFGPAVMISALGLFLAFRGMPTLPRLALKVSRLAPYAFGVYMMHPIFLRLIGIAGRGWQMNWPVLSTLAVSVVAFAASAVAAWAMARTPMLRRLVE